MAHTPTPWAVRPSNDNSGDVGITANGVLNVIAECFSAMRHAGENARDEAAANAAFIVKAVNAHEDLIAALRTLLDEHVQLVNSGDAGFWDPEEEPKVIAARAALAKAGAAP